MSPPDVYKRQPLRHGWPILSAALLLLHGTYLLLPGVEIIGGSEGADPASVVFDAVSAAKARKADVLLIDTAGRLHNKKNLMEELKKINRIIEREYPDAYRETLVVLDGTTGQNALELSLIHIFLQ